MNNTMCAYCKQQLAPGDYDGVCAACDEASEQVGPYYEAQIEALEAKLSRIRAILADETLNTSTAVEIAIRDVMTAD